MFKKTSNQDQAAVSSSVKNSCYDEGKYQALFMASRDAVMTLEGPSWKFTSGNPATTEMFKAKDEAEFLSYEPWKLSPEFQPDGRASDKKAREMIEKAMREGSNFFEWTHKRLNGENFFAEVLLSRIEYGGGAFLHAVVRDITERKKMEERLKEQEEEKFKIIFDSTNEGMLLVDIQTKKFYLGNNAICRMLGYASEELKGLSIENVCPQESAPYVLEQFRKQVAGGLELVESLPVKRKDGSIFYADINSSKIMIGERIYGLSVFRDVTEHKQMEEALRESEERFRKIFENGQYGIILTGSDLKFIKANPAFCRITGYSEAELITKMFSDINEQKKIEGELKKKYEEIEKMNKFMIDRELKMVEIKKELKYCKKEK